MFKRFVLKSEDEHEVELGSIELTDEQVGILIDALDSYEYWEHRDELPHDSGHITIMDDQDFEQQIILGGYDEDEVELKLEQWNAVKAARTLISELESIRPKASV